MNTLDDLRTTLAAHTHGEDAALLDRTTAVRARVRVVRRRRRVSTAVGAVVTVAVVVAGVALPRLATDRGRADLAAATSVTIGGFDYDLVDVVSGEPGDTEVTATVPWSHRPMAVVLLGDHLAGGEATLQTSQDLGATDRFTDRIVADGRGRAVQLLFPTDHEPATAQARADGAGPTAEIGIAVYRRSDAMPDGVVDPTGSSVFRRQVGARRLLAGAFAEPGRAEQTITFTGALSDVRIAEFCSVPGGSSPKGGPFVHVSLDGSGFLSSGCASPAEDASLGFAYWPEEREVREHTARVWISGTEGGEPTPAPDAVVGLAVYGAADTVQVHGSTIDRVVEHDGQTWRLDEVLESKGGHEIEFSRTDLSVPLLVGYATEGTRKVTTGGTIQGGGHVDDTAGSVAETRSSSLVGILLPTIRGHRETFVVRWPARYAGASGAILVYRPLD